MPAILASLCWRRAACGTVRYGTRGRPIRGGIRLRRYRQAGASGTALFAFPARDIGCDAFFMTNLMADYSAGVVLEGDNPLGFVHLSVFVAPAPPAGETLFVRRLRNRAAEQAAKAARLERVLRGPDGVAELFGEVFGDRMAALARAHPAVIETARDGILADILAARQALPPPPVEQLGDRRALCRHRARSPRHRQPSHRCPVPRGSGSSPN